MQVRAFQLLPALVAATLWGCDGTGAYGGDPGALADIEATYGDTLSGARLAATLGCGACHAGAPVPESARAAAPPLADLIGRWDPRPLARYLERPVPLRAGRVARMPDFQLDATEAAALAMHLLSGDGSRPTRSLRSGLAALGRDAPGATAERGAAIADALNCAGCHAGTDAAAWFPGPPLTGLGERLRADWLRGYLAAPVPVRPFGFHPGSGSRMPDFRLSAAEADSLTGWLTGAASGGTTGEAGADGAGRAHRMGVTSLRAARAEALLRDRLSCLGCHRLGADGGRIGPRLDGVGARLEPAYLRRVVTDPAGAVPGTMMPRPLEDSATISLIIDYLLVTPPGAGPDRYLSLVENAPARPSVAADAAPRDLYAARCAACHGHDGAGAGFNAPHLPRPPTAHADAAHMASRPDATLFDGTWGGGHILGKSHRMPGFGAALSPSQIRGLVAHMRELCDCVEPGWASP